MSLKIKVPNIIYLGSAVPSGGGSAKQVALLSITTAPSGTFEKGSQYYNSSDKKIYTAVADNTWETANQSDPQFNTYYIYNNQTYVWDGNSLELFELEEYQKKLVSGENIKTINGDSVLGSGNLAVKTYQVFPSSWHTTTTFSEFLNDINSDNTAVEGMAYLGDLACSGLPTGISNAEVVVEIINSTTNTKCIHAILTSGDVNPYRWEYTYWNNGSSVSGWIGFQPKLTAGENINIQDNTISAVDTKPNLFDIKTLSQAIAGEEEKGWACLSHTSRKDIAKASVPTLYNDILLNKFNNVDTGATDFTLYTTGLNRNNYIVLDGDYYYFCWSTNQGNNLKKCLTSNLNIPGSDIDVKDGDNNSIPVYRLTGFHKSDNMFVLSYREYKKLIIKFYNKNWVLVETKEFIHEGWVDYYGCSYVKEDNNDYYWYIQLKTETGQNKRLIKIKDDLNDLTVIDIASGYAYKVWNIKRYNGYYFYGCEERQSVYKTQLAENIGSSSNVIKCVDNCAGEFTIIGNTIKAGGSNGWGKISFDKGETWQSPSGYNSGYQSQINDNLVFYSQSDNLYTTNDLVNYTLFGTISGGGTGYVQYENDTTIYTTDGKMWYSSVVKTQYIDKYQISSDPITTVDITYYKFNDWKICIPNITVNNDTNLDRVYEYLGYHNYWRLDTINETISLPRNSNLWTMMYVGDDYEDSNLPIGSFSNAPKKIIGTSTPTTTTVGSVGDIFVDVTNVKIYVCTNVYWDNTINNNEGAYVYVWTLQNETDINNLLPSQTGNTDKFLTTNGTTVSWAEVQKIITFTNKEVSIWVSDSTYSGYGYKAEISCNGVTSSMVANVIFAPTEADSGNYATVCDTDTNTVTIYSKVNTTITIPTIVAMEG